MRLARDISKQIEENLQYPGQIRVTVMRETRRRRVRPLAAGGIVRVDLHTHSLHSDGVRTPEWVVSRAAANGATLLALTDHDTLNGVPAALAAGRAATCGSCPASSLGTRNGELGELHVLGYFPAHLRPDDSAIDTIESVLAGYRDDRSAAPERSLIASTNSASRSAGSASSASPTAQPSDAPRRPCARRSRPRPIGPGSIQPVPPRRGSRVCRQSPARSRTRRAG